LSAGGIAREGARRPANTFPLPKSEMSKPLSALFVGHGNPMNALLEQRLYGRVGRSGPEPSAFQNGTGHLPREIARIAGIAKIAKIENAWKRRFFTSMGSGQFVRKVSD